MRGVTTLVVGIVVSLATFGRSARGADTAESLANRALAMFQQETRRTEALGLYHDALDSAQGPLKTQIMANLGKAYGSIGRPAEAWAYLTWAVQRDPTLEPELRDALAFVTDLLQADHARVTVQAQPSDAILTFGDPAERLEMPSPATWWVDGAGVAVSVRRSGYAAKRQVVAATGPSEVVIVLEPSPEPTVESKPSPRETAARTALPQVVAPVSDGPHWDRVATWKWVLLGSGGALALAGTGTFGGALAKANDLNGRRFATRDAYDDAWASDVKPLELASYVLWGVGGAALVAGGTLVLVEAFAEEASPSGGGVSVVPMATPGVAGFVVVGSF